MLEIFTQCGFTKSYILLVAAAVGPAAFSCGPSVADFEACE